MKKWLPLLLKMLKNYLVRNVQQNIAFVIMGVQIFIPLFLQSIKKRGVRVVEGARLESVYRSKAYRGFESRPLRQIKWLNHRQNRVRIVF